MEKTIGMEIESLVMVDISILKIDKANCSKIIRKYNLTGRSKILDIGCGKGYLLYEIKKILPKINIYGLDVSKYAQKNSHPEIRNKIKVLMHQKNMNIKTLRLKVISINTLHNLEIDKLSQSLKEISRIGKNLI